MKMRSNGDYFRGVGWFMLSVMTCQMNDTIMKYLSLNIHPVQTIFLRFLFAVLWLVPFFIYPSGLHLRTSRWPLHFCRGLMLFCAEVLWCFGLRHAALPTAVVIGFSMPLFLLLLAHVFLGERISRLRFWATIVGFLGILIVWNPFSAALTWAIIPLVGSAILFAGMDILNRKFVLREGTFAMVLYTALFTLLFSVVPTFYLWQTMSVRMWICAAVLGGGADLIMLFLLRAFRHLEASATAPYRYTELIFSIFTGYFFFSDLPTLSTLLGAMIIIPSTLVLLCYEGRNRPRSASTNIDMCC